MLLNDGARGTPWQDWRRSRPRCVSTAQSDWRRKMSQSTVPDLIIDGGKLFEGMDVVAVGMCTCFLTLTAIDCCCL